MINEAELKPEAKAEKVSKNGAAKPEFRVDLSAWKIKDYEAWGTAVDAGNLSTMNAMASQVIKAWPYASDSTNVESYGELNVAEYKRAMKEIGRAVTAAFQESE